MKIKNMKGKTAGKPSKRVKNIPSAITPIELPKGFKAVSSGFAPSWGYEEQPLLVGTILAFAESPGKYKDAKTKKFNMQKNAVIEQADGRGSVTVWESAGTRALFDLKKGALVAITFNGFKKIKNRKEPMKDFTVATK